MTDQTVIIVALQVLTLVYAWLREGRRHKWQNETRHEINDVHQAVNGGQEIMKQELKAAKAEIETLKEALLNADVKHPLWTKGPQ